MSVTKKIVLEALYHFSDGGKHNLRPTGLLQRLIKRTKLSQLDVGLALQTLREEGVVKSASWGSSPTCPQAMVEIQLREKDVPEWAQEWNNVLVSNDRISDADRQALDPAGEALQELPQEMKVRLLQGLVDLRNNQQRFQGEPQYLVSARHLLGASKLLDRLKGPAREFGIDIDSFQPSPKYLAVAGPSQPLAVILVENPNCFEAAIRAGASKQFAWICTYGFGVANEKSDQDGAMLQANLTHRVTHVLTREGNPPKNPSVLLRHSNLFFWGDLDLMGMTIFDRLKRHFPQLKLSALYEPMIKALYAGRSHPYIGCVGKKGQKAQRLNDPMAQRLAALCHDRAVDQEIVKDGFEKLGLHPLAESALERIESRS